MQAGLDLAGKPQKSLFGRLNMARSAFLRWPAKLQGAAVFGAASLFLGLVAVACYLGKWAEWKSRSEDWVFITCILLGSLAPLACVGWAVRSMMFHIERGNAAMAALKRLRTLMDTSTWAVYSIDLEGRCTFCNPACLRILGFEDLSQLLGADLEALLFAGEHRQGLPSPFVAAMRDGRNLHIAEGTARRADGSRVVLERWASLIREDERIVGAVITVADVTLERAARSALRREHAALEDQVRDLSKYSSEMALFSQLAEMLQACDSMDELGRVVASFSKSLFPGVAGDLSILEPVNGLLDPQVSWGGPPNSAGAAPFGPQDCWALRRGKPHYQEGTHEDIFCTHTTRPLPAYTFCLPLTGQGATLGHLHLRAASSSSPLLSEARQLEAIALAYQVSLGLSNLKLKETLREEAIRDPVTGLFNRRFMQESLAHEIQRARRSGTSVAIIAFDIDHFKDVNDTLGHAAGDSLLSVLANVAKGGMRVEDIACRQGGDEFILILPDTSEENALMLAEKLRQKTSQFTRLQFPELDGRVTLSIGVALFPMDAPEPEALLKAADRALYRAKTLGRNCVFAASALNSSQAVA